ncbi:protein transport protein HofB [Salmonella bongori]|nr:protein transport protein HofB [Salmonella bongori]
MKDAQLNTLCQRHQAVLMNSDNSSISVAVVDAPPLMNYSTPCISPRKNRSILCAGPASKWRIIYISSIRCLR